MQLAALVDPELIFAHLPAYDVASLLRAIAGKVTEHGRVTNADELFDALWEREQLGSTGIGHGIAVPHCKLAGIDKVIMAVAHTAQPIDFGAVDKKPVRLFFTVVSPHSDPAAHLQCLAAISVWIQKSGAVESLLDLSDTEQMFLMLTERG